jgi:uncharacterized protein (UPF0335 family)
LLFVRAADGSITLLLGGLGFDSKILKKVIAIRKQDKDERMEQEAILETYLAALGMIEGPPEE